MNLKPCLLAGMIAVALAGESVAQRLHAQDLYDSAAPIVLAQSEGGFFGRIFNDSNSSSDAKPLFLNKGKQQGGYQEPIKPHDMSQHSGPGANARGGRREMSQWEQLMAQADENTEFALAKADAAVAEVRAQTARERKAAASAGQANTVGKKMVYDPDRVWTYTNPKRRDAAPQQPQEQEDKRPVSRIYNTR